MKRTYLNSKVVRWVDADTVIIMVDLGFKIFSEQKFRLARINTPEKGQPGFTESVVRVNEIAPVGSALVIDSMGLDKYGRWVAELYIPDNLISINQMLLNEGMAVAVSY